MNIELLAARRTLGREDSPAKDEDKRARREKHLTTGAISLFSESGLAIFLYDLSVALVLKLPPDVVAKVPLNRASGADDMAGRFDAGAFGRWAIYSRGSGQAGSSSGDWSCQAGAGIKRRRCRSLELRR